jgi:hypothetical protein
MRNRALFCLIDLMAERKRVYAAAPELIRTFFSRKVFLNGRVLCVKKRMPQNMGDGRPLGKDVFTPEGAGDAVSAAVKVSTMTGKKDKM